MTYQLRLPGIVPPLAGPRREPRQRKGESWRSFAFRHETWRRATRREKTPEELAEQVRINQEWRESVMRSTEVWCYHQVEAAKRNKTMRGYEHCANPVFFWFGGDYPMEISPVCCGYVNQRQLDWLLEKGILDADRKSRRRKTRHGKNRVSFGPCGL